MPTLITINAGNMRLNAELNDSLTAQAIISLLPARVRMSRWGDEYYGSLPKKIGLKESADARDVLAVGELAYWAPGNALCIFFGPTPASEGNEPRAASPVNPVGRISGDTAGLKMLRESIEVVLESCDRR